MADEATTPEEPLELDKLGPANTLIEIINGIGIALGLCLLWSLEAVRNGYFRILDRRNVRPRQRRASAFPPGRPRKKVSAEARR
jgi:hypothetical protein